MMSYNSIDKRIHQLTQIIAKVNRTLVPQKEDDSHTNLSFEPIENRIYGRWFKQNKRSYIFALELNSLAYVLLNSKKEILETYVIIGKSRIEIEEAIKKSFKTLGFETSNLMDELHFEIPTYEFKDVRWEKLSESEISLWSNTRELANRSCEQLLGLAQKDGEVRIWPHHFDTGIYFKVTENLGVGFGFAMKDEIAKDSYYYMVGYPENYTISYTDLPKEQGWNWVIGESWNGVVLPLDQLKDKAYQEQMLLINKYLHVNYQWFINN